MDFLSHVLEPQDVGSRGCLEELWLNALALQMGSVRYGQKSPERWARGLAHGVTALSGQAGT